MKVILLPTLGLLLTATAASAQTIPAADSVLAVPALVAPPEPETKPLTLYGFVDGYYGYDFKHVFQQKDGNTADSYGNLTSSIALSF